MLSNSNYSEIYNLFKDELSIYPFEEEGLIKYFSDDFYSTYIVKIKSSMSKKRYIHSLGVAFTAARLAKFWGCDIDTCFLTGLLHDCGKEAPGNTTPVSHAIIGVRIAEEEYGIRNPAILSGIRNHVNGCPDMSLLDKIIFISDYIEPGRTLAKNLDSLRSLAFIDLDKTVLKITEDTIDYLKSSNAVIDSSIYKTYDFYKEKV